MVSTRVKDLGTRARRGCVRKGRLRKTKHVKHKDDELVAREGIMRLGAGNNAYPGVSRGTKFSFFVFEDGGKNCRKATVDLLGVDQSLGVGEMLNVRNVIRGCSVEGL
jgi:hypothetical protein